MARERISNAVGLIRLCGLRVVGVCGICTMSVDPREAAAIVILFYGGNRASNERKMAKDGVGGVERMKMKSQEPKQMNTHRKKTHAQTQRVTKIDTITSLRLQTHTDIFID